MAIIKLAVASIRTNVHLSHRRNSVAEVHKGRIEATSYFVEIFRADNADSHR
jgi:hypothetical protein